MTLLMNSFFLQLVITALSIYWAGWIIYCRFFHPLRFIPGPFLASISRVWIVYKIGRGDMEYTQRALHKKYGHLVRIAPNEVSCSDPSAIKIIYGTKPLFNKTEFYDAWQSKVNKEYAGHFQTRDEKAHTERRRIVNSVYSIASVLESEDVINSCTQILCDTMRNYAKKKSKVDLSVWMNMYAFDVIGELFFGKDFGFMKEKTDVGNYMKAIHGICIKNTIAGTVPSYLSGLTFPTVTLFCPSFRGTIEAIINLSVSSKTAMDRRMREIEENTDDRRDLIRKLMEISADRGEKVNFNTNNIYAESHSSFFAGADTTAIAMSSILGHLIRNPVTYERLTSEIDTATAVGSFSMPVKYKEAIKLPYLRACINEGMRLHPSVGLSMPRHVPPGGTTIDGVFIPEGYIVGMNPAVVQYDKNLFGLDAEQYNPDRWLGADAPQMEKAMLHFGIGTRICIGKNIALSEIYKLIPQLLREFHIRLEDPAKGLETRNYWFNKVINEHVYFEEHLDSSF